MASKKQVAVAKVLHLGQNVAVAVEGDEVVIRIKKNENFGNSSSGKSTIIATTSGNQEVPLGDGRTAKLGLNLYVKN